MLFSMDFFFTSSDRSTGEQHAAEAPRSSELQEEGIMGIMDLHRGDHHPGSGSIQ